MCWRLEATHKFWIFMVQWAGNSHGEHLSIFPSCTVQAVRGKLRVSWERSWKWNVQIGVPFIWAMNVWMSLHTYVLCRWWMKNILNGIPFCKQPLMLLKKGGHCWLLMLEAASIRNGCYVPQKPSIVLLQPCRAWCCFGSLRRKLPVILLMEEILHRLGCIKPCK